MYNKGMNKVFIFDFDGTIADSQRIVIELFNKYAEEFESKKIISDDDIHHLRSGGLMQAINYLHVPKLKIPFFIRKVLKDYRKQIVSVSAIPDIQSVLLKIHDKNIYMGIITSNDVNNVKTFLQNNHIDFFDFIHSESDLLGKHRTINKVLKEYKFDKTSVIYIGDEIRDIEAAKKSEIKVAAVSWGFNAREALQKALPDYLFDQPSQLLSLL